MTEVIKLSRDDEGRITKVSLAALAKAHAGNAPDFTVNATARHAASRQLIEIARDRAEKSDRTPAEEIELMSRDDRYKTLFRVYYARAVGVHDADVVLT